MKLLQGRGVTAVVVGFLALIILTACQNNQTSGATGTSSHRASSAAPVASPSATRIISWTLDRSAWPGKSYPRLTVRDADLQNDLQRKLSVSGGWRKANVAFAYVADVKKAQIVIKAFNQQAINSDEGCYQGQDGDVYGCAGWTNDGRGHKYCNIYLRYAVTDNGHKYEAPATGMVLHEAGHCFFGPKHYQNDPVMMAVIPLEKIEFVRPGKKLIDELRSRANARLMYQP